MNQPRLLVPTPKLLIPTDGRVLRTFLADMLRKIAFALDSLRDGKSDTDHLHTGVYDPAGTAEDEVTAHVAESDPHTQYQKESEKGAANGYAGLNADSRVTAAVLNIRDQAGQTLTVNGTTDGAIVYRDGTALKAVVAEAFVDAPSGGPTQDAEARTAIDGVRAILIAHGLMAAS